MKTRHTYIFTDSERHGNQRCHRHLAETAPSDLTHGTQSEHFSTIHPAKHATRRMSDQSDQQRRPRTRCYNPCRTSQSTTPTNCKAFLRNQANSTVFHRASGFDGHNYPCAMRCDLGRRTSSLDYHHDRRISTPLQLAAEDQWTQKMGSIPETTQNQEAMNRQ